jgi:hypothetical protein
MKKLLLLGLSFIMMVNLFGQSQGISYQAVIIDQNPLEVPGEDISGNILPNHDLMIRFTILDAAGTIEYKEEHSTTTDEYGMINLVIGKGIPMATSPKSSFPEIDWDGSPKALKVDISFSDTDVFFSDFGYEELTFVPYAYHKNITATGSLIVDGVTDLKSRLQVSDGSPTFLTGDLQVDEYTTLQSDLTVNAPSQLKGQVTISSDLTGSNESYDAYPLRVEGATQGIAVKINGERDADNFFVTFWDDKNIQGRIEGQTSTDLLKDPEYIFDNVIFATDIVSGGIDVGKAIAEIVTVATSSTLCVGVVPCVTTPAPSEIIKAAADLILEIAKLAIVVAQPIAYNVFKHTQIGVSYQSGAGDYAEWLLKADPNETFQPGDIVGVFGGRISKSTEDADHLLVISFNPIVLGNMPQEGKEADYEKVAFMGQVPVKVVGDVHTGDFILASGFNNGLGLAVSPDVIRPDQYCRIVGTAWSASDSLQVGFVNLAVGLNANDMARLNMIQEERILAQETEMDVMKDQISQMNAILEQVIPEYYSMMNEGSKKSALPNVYDDPSLGSGDRLIVYHEFTREHIQQGLELAEKILKERGEDISNNPFFERIKSEPAYKEEVFNDVLTSVRKETDTRYEKDLKTGARVIKMY